MDTMDTLPMETQPMEAASMEVQGTILGSRRQALQDKICHVCVVLLALCAP